MSAKRKELSAFQHREIIGAWKCKFSERKISEALEYPKVQFMKLLLHIEIMDMKHFLLEVVGHLF